MATHKHISVSVFYFSEVFSDNSVVQDWFQHRFDQSEVIWMTGYAEQTRNVTDKLGF